MWHSASALPLTKMGEHVITHTQATKADKNNTGNLVIFLSNHQTSFCEGVAALGQMLQAALRA